mgnify:FL=1
METKDLNSIGLAYLEMVEKRNIEAKKNHAAVLAAAALDEKMDPTDHVKQNDNGMWCVYSKDNKKLKEFKKESDANAWAVDNHDTLMSEAKKKLHPNQKALDADGDGDIEADDLADLRKDADKDDKKFDKKKKSSKKDDDDEQEKFKAYTGDDKNDQEGTSVREDKFEPHMMYDPKTGKGYKAEKEEDHLRMKKMGYTHDKPEEIDEAKNITTDNNALVSFYQKHSNKYRLVGHMNAGVIGSQHQMLPADTKNISNQAVKAGVGKMVKVPNSMLKKHIADYKNENKPAPPEIAVALSQHHAKSVVESSMQFEGVKATGAQAKALHKLMLSALGKKQMPNARNGHTSSIATNGDFVVHGSMGQVAGRIKKGDFVDPMKESTDLQEGAARQAAFHKGLMNYCKEIGKDHMDHKDFMDHAKHVKAGDWDKARTHADGMDTEVREKIHTLAIDHLGQGAASELYGGDRVSLSKKEGDGKLHASYNESVNVDEATIPDGQTAMTKKPELTKKDKKTMGKIADLMKTANESVNVDDVLALIDQGYTLDQAEAMVAEAACGTVNASRQGKAGELERNVANDQRSIPVKSVGAAPVRPGTKQQQRDFDQGAKLAKPPKEVSLKPMPAALSKKMETDEELHGDQHKLDHNKDGKITAPDLAKVRTHGAVKKANRQESVMNRVSNMVENIRADIQEKNEINEVSKGTLRDYAKKAVHDIDKQKADADKFEFRGMASQSRKVQHKNFAKATDADRKAGNRKKGIGIAVDKLARESVKEGVPTTRKELQKYRFAGEYEKSGMKYPYSTADTSKADEAEARAMIAQTRTSVNKNKAKKESVQEAAKPTGIHHSTPVTAAQANDEQARGRWTDKAGRNTMTEKEFVDMHTIHPDVLPEFDGNVAAKKTAEAIKKAPKVSPTPNPNPNAGDKNKVKSTEAPAANAGVVGESYMDKYAKYIRGEI